MKDDLAKAEGRRWTSMKKSKRKGGRRAAGSRSEVRQLTRRVNVPRSSKRPAERSKQRRSRRP
jgi:hypothetical protein